MMSGGPGSDGAKHQELVMRMLYLEKVATGRSRLED